MYIQYALLSVSIFKVVKTPWTKSVAFTNKLNKSVLESQKKTTETRVKKFSLKFFYVGMNL